MVFNSWGAPNYKVEEERMYCVTVYNKTEKTFKNEQRSKDAAAKKRPNIYKWSREN